MSGILNSVLFFPWSLKVRVTSDFRDLARALFKYHGRFLENFHEHFFVVTGTFLQKCHRWPWTLYKKNIRIRVFQKKDKVSVSWALFVENCNGHFFCGDFALDNRQPYLRKFVPMIFEIFLFTKHQCGVRKLKMNYPIENVYFKRSSMGVWDLIDGW